MNTDLVPVLTRWLYCVECPQYTTVICSKMSAICTQAVYFLHSTMLSVTCLQMSDISVICRITSITYSFQFMSAFLPHRSARPRSSILGLANIGHWMLPKIWLDFLY